MVSIDSIPSVHNVIYNGHRCESTPFAVRSHLWYLRRLSNVSRIQLYSTQLSLDHRQQSMTCTSTTFDTNDILKPKDLLYRMKRRRVHFSFRYLFVAVYVSSLSSKWFENFMEICEYARQRSNDIRWIRIGHDSLYPHFRLGLEFSKELEFATKFSLQMGYKFEIFK